MTTPKCLQGLHEFDNPAVTRCYQLFCTRCLFWS